MPAPQQFSKEKALTRSAFFFGADYGVSEQKLSKRQFVRREANKARSIATEERGRKTTMRLGRENPQHFEKCLVGEESLSAKPKQKNKSKVISCTTLDKKMERITGLEPATSTLARWRSTK